MNHFGPCEMPYSAPVEARAEPAGPSAAELVAKLSVDRDVHAAVCAQNLKMRDKLLEIAAACLRCNGTGTVTRYFNYEARVIPCPHCEDVREALR